MFPGSHCDLKKGSPYKRSSHNRSYHKDQRPTEVISHCRPVTGGSKEFQASSGWLERFTNRHRIRQLSIVAEKLSSEIEAGNSFISELQDLIVKPKLTADQIYNCDETGLYWRALATKTLTAENIVVAQGRKKMRDRMKILGYPNASGSHRVKLTCGKV
ncbi:Jerky -like [Araneus ventricosus]|uniref:Jerky-like n=1 Tax=Araneus ventricosus TaxID=182803 RepID=A0A4Y2Q0S4_ARAVE|nr:Jerky -like [Araneus ventricosus]